MEIENRNSQLPTMTADDLRQQIETRAYELYLARGAVDGFHEQDWLRAEDEIINSIIEPAVAEIREIPKPLKKAAKHA
jgi:hypothetical protein